MLHVRKLFLYFIPGITTLWMCLYILDCVVYVRVCLQVHLIVHAEARRRWLMSRIIILHLVPFRQYVWLSLDLGWWPVSTSKSSVFACPTALGLQMLCPHLAFDLGSGDSNLGLHSYSGHVLTHHLSICLLVIGQLVASF